MNHSNMASLLIYLVHALLWLFSAASPVFPRDGERVVSVSVGGSPIAQRYFKGLKEKAQRKLDSSGVEKQAKPGHLVVIVNVQKLPSGEQKIDIHTTFHVRDSGESIEISRTENVGWTKIQDVGLRHVDYYIDAVVRPPDVARERQREPQEKSSNTPPEKLGIEYLGKLMRSGGKLFLMSEDEVFLGVVSDNQLDSKSIASACPKMCIWS